MEEKIDHLSNALMAVQTMIANKGILDEGSVADKTNGRRSQKDQGAGQSLAHTGYETTIYANAVQKEIQKDNNNITVDSEIEFNFNKQSQTNNQSSDEQEADTSDEAIKVTERFIADCAADVERRRSLDMTGNADGNNGQNQSTRMLRDAEDAKLHIVATPGKEINVQYDKLNAQAVDDNYLVIGVHIDQTMKQKIANHKYVDFARLLPKDRITSEDDHRMQLLSRGGSTYFVPVADRESAGNINSFQQWEQAFRVFSDAYTRLFLDHAPELVQYNHIIFTASQSFAWDNVYRYDKEFRMHLSNFPGRSWVVILQQAWSLCLKDKVRASYDQNSPQRSGHHKEICKRFNRGKCTAGASCKYDHCCAIKTCGKWGHGAHICRNKLATASNATSQAVQNPGLVSSQVNK